MGKRPLSPRELKKLQGKMRTVELNGVEEVIIRFSNKEIAIPNPTVSKITFGEEMYQVIGQGVERPITTNSQKVTEKKVSEDDIELVMAQTGASREEAEKALDEENGDLAGAIVRLKSK
ncbi:MAG: Nascent polypeptide-associated complex protein [Candidatus Heimdallarchaeum aukensis]|uniref:Nascent polypeptide-associated complex protein n=1 Tax=Candidatus Heimdallarchaeum aukensis TaxID=2876573 RepID=A0A9Y1BJ74_9ARCH|nr:MAG: Nascent polypeptide-associated complex protein [Candidatus Heimdallarchaeum aukensis]